MSSNSNPVSIESRLGLVALALYGLTVFVGSISSQPDYATDFPAYAEYVTTPWFLVSHLAFSIAGTTIGILALIALSAALSTTTGRRLALPALVTSVAGLALIMTLFGAAAFAQPAIGSAYIAGAQATAVEINADVYGVPTIVPSLVVGISGVVLYLIGGVLFGMAVWRSGRLPRWSGVMYAVAVALISLVGQVIPAARPLGGLLLAGSALWMAMTILPESNEGSVASSAAPAGVTPTAKPEPSI